MHGPVGESSESIVISRVAIEVKCTVRFFWQALSECPIRFRTVKFPTTGQGRRSKNLLHDFFSCSASLFILFPFCFIVFLALVRFCLSSRPHPTSLHPILLGAGAGERPRWKR